MKRKERFEPLCFWCGKRLGSFTYREIDSPDFQRCCSETCRKGAQPSLDEIKNIKLAFSKGKISLKEAEARMDGILDSKERFSG